MSIVTLQIGQAGNQLGSELFAMLAEELKSSAHDLSPAASSFFYSGQVGGETRLTARSVLLDMEPKVIQHASRAGKGRWVYSKLGQLMRQSGSGNNWAMGYHFHGAQVKDQAMNMIRRQVERCDSFGGFLVLQSVAGGTGSGLGTFISEQIREEYTADFMLNQCLWPYESGEVVVQPYNSILTLSHLNRVSDGVILVENEAVHATCQKLLNIQRPSFADMNAVAARNLASVLLPSTVRQAEGRRSSGAAGPADPRSNRSGATVSSRGRPSVAGGGKGGRPAWDSGFGGQPAACESLPRGLAEPSGLGSSALSTAAAWDGTFDTGSRWDDDDGCWGAGHRGGASRRRGSGSSPGQLRVLGDVCEQLCAHPSYRLLTLRSVPQMPSGSVDFTTFSWPALLGRLKDMLAAGRTVEADWATSLGSRSKLSGRQHINKSISSLLVLRGVQAREADASCFLDPALNPSWQHDPLLVAASNHKISRLDMCATLLSNCQTPVAPVSRMLGKASRLYDARAYVHQYDRYGMEQSTFDQAFEDTEDLLAKYQAL